MDEQPSGKRKRTRRTGALIAFAVAAPLVVAASWRIAAKAGYPPAFALLTVVSPVNLFVLMAFATREWPIERELRLARTAAANSGAEPTSL